LPIILAFGKKDENCNENRQKKKNKTKQQQQQQQANKTEQITIKV